ncbi:hypothetical protein BUALT_Bualt07G0103000 [Buddleja alternifolia]|uniref:Mitochondrial import inner membrane translocase subunit Tim16 n=1 Tax=Buddleja alternifolia TaxID=168488 RepID=A0AAV6XAX5_9LAMI|nr:hypothetical protein BUALT_Bualt07G0103000 [Buddleja alternifolia]
MQIFKLEDVAMGIWIADMKKKGLEVRYEKDERIIADGCKDVNLDILEEYKDTSVWRFTANGSYSCKRAYEAYVDEANDTGEDKFSGNLASKLLANLIIMGSGIMARAFVQAYRQALANASRNGVAQEAVNNIRRGSKMMTETEARQILGVTEHSSWEEILKRYDNLFERNTKNGSFYLQSKVHRAKECLETVHQTEAHGAN